jgi:hypothetical protein
MRWISREGQQQLKFVRDNQVKLVTKQTSSGGHLKAMKMSIYCQFNAVSSSQSLLITQKRAYLFPESRQDVL